MYKICKTKQSAERQKLFQKTLLNMMDKHPYRSITITALCNEMGAPRRAFYRYFDALDDVLYAELDEILSDAFFEIETDLRKIFEYWAENREILRILEKNGMIMELINRAYNLKFIKDIKTNKRTDLMKYASVISGILTLIVTWYQMGMLETPEEMEKLTYSIYYQTPDDCK